MPLPSEHAQPDTPGAIIGQSENLTPPLAADGPAPRWGLGQAEGRTRSPEPREPGPPADHPPSAALAPRPKGYTPAPPLPPQPPADPAPAGTSSEREYGLYAVLAGLVVLTALDITALVYLRHNISSAVALIGAVSTPIVAIVSAYFGIKAGARSGTAAAAAADKARQQAEVDRKRSDYRLNLALGHLSPADADHVLGA